MANREQRGNREKRKPAKTEKSNAPPTQASPFARNQPAGNDKNKGSKKGR